jgi:hypothetical protein
MTLEFYLPLTLCMELDPDPHSSKRLFPDPHVPVMNRESKHCYLVYCTVFTVVKQQYRVLVHGLERGLREKKLQQKRSQPADQKTH